MKQKMLFAAVYEALGPDRCAVCRLSLDSVHRMLDGLLYEQVNDPWIRERLVNACGFCPTHAWKVRALNSPLGTAIIHRHLLEELLETFRGALQAVPASAKKRTKLPWQAHLGTPLELALAAWLKGRATCPACEVQHEAEGRYSDSVARAFDDPDFRAKYREGLGVCVRHIRGVLAEVAGPTDVEWFTGTEREIIQRLASELSEFVRKHDYRFAKEPRGNEGTSWIRVIEKLAGAPGMVWISRVTRKHPRR